MVVFTMMNGWIKISRDIMQWQHYKEPYVVVVFLDLLLSATHKDTTYRGVKLKRGESVASIRGMATRLNMSVNTVQSCLKKLVSSGEIVRTPFKYGIRTKIVNYNRFQGVSLNDTVSPNDTQDVSRDDTQGVSPGDTIQEHYNKNTPIPARVDEDGIDKDFYNACIKSGQWLEEIAMHHHTTIEVVADFIKDCSRWIYKNNYTHWSVQDKRSFVNKQIQKIEQNGYKLEQWREYYAAKRNSRSGTAGISSNRQQQAINAAMQASISLAAKSGQTTKLPF